MLLISMVIIHIDLFTNPGDAIGSVANYFHQHGWSMGEPVVAAAQITKPSALSFVQERVELKQNGDLKQAGINHRGTVILNHSGQFDQLAQPSYSEYWVARKISM